MDYLNPNCFLFHLNFNLHSMKITLFLSVFLCLFSFGSLQATVIDSTNHGFTTLNKVTIKASPTEVYDHFVHHIGKWWSDAHSWSGQAANITIAAQLGGCWCERLPNNGMAEHARLIYMAPGESLHFVGELGPLQTLAVTGKMTINFKSVDGGTEVELLYTVGGYVKGGLKPIAGAVDGVMRQQLGRLKGFVERG